MPQGCLPFHAITSRQIPPQVSDAETKAVYRELAVDGGGFFSRCIVQISSEEWSGLMERASKMDFRRGDRLLREGDPVDGLYQVRLHRRYTAAALRLHCGCIAAALRRHRDYTALILRLHHDFSAVTPRSPSSMTATRCGRASYAWR